MLAPTTRPRGRSILHALCTTAEGLLALASFAEALYREGLTTSAVRHEHGATMNHVRLAITALHLVICFVRAVRLRQE